MRKVHEIEFIRNRIAYNPETGEAIWKELNRNQGLTRGEKVFNTRFAGKAAATCINSWGYRSTAIQGIHYLLHVLIWAIHHGEWPDGEIDHINGDKMDNRISNLRVVDGVTNRRNMPMQKNNTSGVVGVVRKGNKWEARIGNGSGRTYLGVFSCIGEAIRVRKEAEVKLGYSENHGRQHI